MLNYGLFCKYVDLVEVDKRFSSIAYTSGKAG